MGSASRPDLKNQGTSNRPRCEPAIAEVTVNSWTISLSSEDPWTVVCPASPLGRELLMSEQRPPFPPFDEHTAVRKVQAAEDAWNSCDPEKVASGYSEDSVWRNRDSFITGREQIITLLQDKWSRELDYALRKQVWSFTGNRIAVRYQYESHDAGGQWWRSYGNELWEYDEAGLNSRRESSINDLKITEAERRIFGPRSEADRGRDVIGLQ